MPTLFKRITIPVKKDHRETIVSFDCQVSRLDGNPLDVKNVSVDSTGEQLFDRVCELVGKLEEKDYFGLRYLDTHNQRRWLDCSLNAHKQLKHLNPITVRLRVKHYPSHPADNVKQDLARYFIFQQLKRDLQMGRLYCQQTTDNAYLAALIAQAEFGNFDLIDKPDYLTGTKYVLNQTPKLENLIYEEHKKMKDLSPQEAEYKFLERSFTLDSYGIDPVSVRDRNGNSFFIGISHAGVATFYGNKRAHLFKWADVIDMQFHDKMFMIEYNVNAEEYSMAPKRHLLGFKCDSRFAASALWNWAVERKAFFTLSRSAEAKILKSGRTLFGKKKFNSFRFSGRCQKELLSSSDYFLNLNSSVPTFVRLSRNISTNTPRIRRLRSLRANSDRSLDSESDGEEQHLFRSLRGEPGAGQSYTFPRRSRLPGMESTDGTSSTPKKGDSNNIAAQIHTPDSALPEDELPSAIANEEHEDEDRTTADTAFSETDSGVPVEENIVANHASTVRAGHSDAENAVVDQLNQVLAEHDKQGTELPNGDVNADQSVNKKTPAPVQRSLLGGVIRTLFGVTLGLSMLAMFGALFLFESGVESPFLTTVRRYPLVNDFHHHLYVPARTHITTAGYHIQSLWKR